MQRTSGVTQQRTVASGDPMLLKSFKASAQLHQQLAKEQLPIKMVSYKRQDSNSQSRGAVFAMTGKDIVKQALVEKEIARLQHTGKNMQLEQEIAALCNYEHPQSREQTKVLLAKQKESRRDRHIHANKEFERWVERLSKNIDEAYKDIKKDVIGYFEESDQKINLYYASLDDGRLLSCEIDFLDDLNRIIQDHKAQREQKVSNLGERLEELEQDRQRSLTFFCDKLQSNLNDIAFILEPEVLANVAVHRDGFAAQVATKREENVQYVEEVNKRQSDTFIKYQQMRDETEQRWRDLKHNLYVKQFLEDIKQLSFVNPPQRVRLYHAFKEAQLQIFRQRQSFTEMLGQYEISVLTKALVEKWIEMTKQHNERSSKQIDECFDALVRESEQTHSLAMQRYELLSKGLVYAAAKPGIQELLESEYLPIVNLLHEAARELMKQAIKHVEETDLKQVDVLTAFGQFYMKLAVKNDEYRRDLQLQKHTYEIEKATAADKNDEHVERLTNEFTAIKVKLSQALHHPKLQATLDEAFLKLDQLEGEYRRFHEHNITIAKGHPATITTQHEKFEVTVAGLFGLVDVSKRAALEEARYKAAELKAKFQMAKEEYFKKIEEEKAIEEAKNKKGGKAPAAKPKDPKKAAQEMEDRLKEVMKQLGVEKVPEFESRLGQRFLEEVSVQQIVEKMYVSQDEQERLAEQEKLQAAQKNELAQAPPAKVDPKAKAPAQAIPVMELPEYRPELDVVPDPVDHLKDPPVDPQGNDVVAKDVVFEVVYMVKLVSVTKTHALEYVKARLDEFQEEAKAQDREFLESSVLQLDDKLKKHYPLKGKTEVEVFQVRSSQITQHKKRYERHAKSTLEKVDLQTEHFNFHLESGLIDMKAYEKEQRELKQSLAQATTLAKFQGTQNSVKENYFKFGEKIGELRLKLEQLQGAELDFIAAKNAEFIKQSKLFDQGGNYSSEEIDWYVEMMKELDQLVVRQKAARQKKVEELSALMSKIRQEYLDAFEKEYAVAVEELAAKDGTGKKYGRPKRLAQERLRTEMTKCEKAQDGINAKVQLLLKFYDEFSANKQTGDYFNKLQPSFSLRIRRVLMSTLTQIRRYAQHIDALRPDCKLWDMPRISYLETKFDTVLEPESMDLDRKNIEEDLEGMGPLFFQKDGKRFSEWVTEIEKVIKEEAQRIYAGEKAKYLTGADKCPEYLRAYIDNMRRNLDEFKIQSIRDLRNSCEELSALAPRISEMMFGAIEMKYTDKLLQATDTLMVTFSKRMGDMSKKKEHHKHLLKPNLANPLNKAILDELCTNEKTRLASWMEDIKANREGILRAQFGEGQEFFKAVMQNFEFCLLYFDCCVLFEDFVKLPGDEQILKKHQNLKVSLRQKQSGIVVDTSSERSLTKEWPGQPIDSFNLDDLRIEYAWSPNAPSQPEAKDPKKKDDKKPAKDEKKGGKDQTVVESETTTKSLKSFKTHRQKSTHQCFAKAFDGFKALYGKQTQQTRDVFKQHLERELKFEFKWEQNVASLFQ